jgi:uncharacterized tellurite resistance protein B-like protein
MSSTPGAADHLAAGLADEVRRSLDRIALVDHSRDGYLSTLALLLHRVALADRDLSAPEVSRMEQILVEQASLSPAEAVLTVAMAAQRCRFGDCVGAYDASRRLRSAAAEDRAPLPDLLEAVAEADGLVGAAERAAIRQIALEIGLPPSACLST